MLTSRNLTGLQRLKFDSKCQLFRCFSSESSNPGSSNDKLGKPQMYHLEHIQKRLEYTVPLMFRRHMDYTFYRADVMYEDRIFQQTKQ